MTETSTPSAEDVAKAAEVADSNARAAKRGAKVSGKVTVACKIEGGLLLRIFGWQDEDRPVMGGGTKVVKTSVQIGEPVRVRGPSAPYGKVPVVPVVGGYGLTSGVDAQFWEKWLEQNRDHDAVRNKLIYACASPETAHGMAEDRSEILSGLQPLVPDTDRRIPRGTNPNISKLQTMDKKDAA